MATQESTNPRERRQHERLKYDGTLHVRCGDQTEWVAVNTRDISVGGLSFYSDVEMQVGAPCALWLPEVDITTFAATVRHVHQRGEQWLIGVAFDEALMTALGHLMRAP